MCKPFFSIIIPVYNSEDTLSASLDSIFSQTFPSDSVEVVVVNDGSPNYMQCDKIVALYRDKLNINYQKLEENRGLYFARKIGVAKAVGKYILHLDSDDLFEVGALQTLYEDIQKNGDADYICFLFMNLCKDGKKWISGYIKDINATNVMEDILTFKVSHNVANKCFNASFAKEIWAKMPSFYAYYNEDYYQMAILHYCAKKKRFLKKPLYIYVQGVGITGVIKYTEEKLRKTILSIYNVDKYLSEFYQQANNLLYIPLLQNYSDGLYIDCIFRSSFEDFISVATEIIGEERVDIVIAKHILNLNKRITIYKKREILFFPIIVCGSFMFKYTKKNKNSIDIAKFINLSTATLKNSIFKKDVFEFVSHLENELSFYEKRAKLYAPIKYVLRSFWRLLKLLLENI